MKYLLCGVIMIFFCTNSYATHDVDREKVKNAAIMAVSIIAIVTTIAITWPRGNSEPKGEVKEKLLLLPNSKYNGLHVSPSLTPDMFKVDLVFEY